jgi:RHS repeat-associated protein
MRAVDHYHMRLLETPKTRSPQLGADLTSYNASGQRIKRTVNGVMTWQIYGFGGELLAEYPANGTATSPQKEYGYRNGELLITAEASLANRTNVALSANGATATASSYLGPPYNYYASYVNDGQRTAAHENIWLDNTYQSFPDWVEVDFNGTKTINEIDVVTQQDSNGNPVEPTLDMTFASYGATAFDVQYWNGASWVTVPNGSITGNNKVWRQFTFANITTSKVRVSVNSMVDNAFSRVVELEAWGEATGGSSANIHWLVADQLGTPRIILDQTGTLANVRRHDYLPFGEELVAPAGGRGTALGYEAGDGIRQQFTAKERDNETGLDFFEARYYASTQGRFTSIDPYNIVLEAQFATDTNKAQSQFRTYLSNPQRWARYTYALNNPLLYTDPQGEDVTIYYRPPTEGAGSVEDQGHILIYVRNDETGEERYFDYTADGSYSEGWGDVHLLKVDQQRIDQHASITIVTDAKQEQAIIEGIDKLVKNAPDFQLGVGAELSGTVSTCSSNSAKLLALGGINVAGAGVFEGPKDLWQSAFSQYGDRQANAAEPLKPNPNPMFPSIGKVNGFDNDPKVGRASRDYGHDPRGQARVAHRFKENRDITIKRR